MTVVPEPGEWWWSKRDEKPVLVQEVSTLWDSTVVRVNGGDGQFSELGLDELQPISEIEPRLTDKAQLVRSASGAKLDDHLQRPDTVTAPLTPTLKPLPHQIQHLHDALRGDVTRLLIADEVGLGKTITAGFILSELKNRDQADRVLVLSPAGLLPQWIQELDRHFGIELTPVFSDLLPTPESGQVWTQFDHVIASYDSVKPIEQRRGWTKETINAYNANRFEALIDAPWDLVIIDEAHRMAGATPGVARHGLASQISTVAPHLLLLTGTPHQGDIDQFHRLVELLDPDTFSTPEAVTQENLEPFLLRTDKKHAVTLDGDPLFVDRATHLTVIPESDRSDLHQQLYEEVTEYVRTGYSAAENDTRSGIGFLMVLVQRLMASSTDALESTLKRRLATLETSLYGADSEGELRIDEFEDPDEDVHEESIEAKSFDIESEIRKIQQLLDIVNQCQAEGPDPKASRLLSLLRNLQQTERDPNAKILIFTKFHPTQAMLREFLETHGYEVSVLNGSMSLEERVQAQEDFEEQDQILISTEAGGEGLNLQFCHLVINFDLPWNPMRIEQRIGRVHRIGQEHPVSAFNMVLGGTVEHRIVEVLDEKLDRIMDQLGVDKLSDVLDTPSIDNEIHQMYREAVETDPTGVEGIVDEQVERIRQKALEASESTPRSSNPIDLEEIRNRLSQPVDKWLDQFVRSSEQSLQPDLRETETRKAISTMREWAPGEAVPKIILSELSASVEGVWSLWRVGVRDRNGRHTARYHPVLETADGEFLAPSAEKVWEEIITGRMKVEGVHGIDMSKSTFHRAQEAAEEACRESYESLLTEHKRRLGDIRRRHESSIQARRSAIKNIGLPEVRSHRLERLRQEDEEWKREHKKRAQVTPLLEPILIATVQGDDE